MEPTLAVDVSPATPRERPTLDRLLQLYQYDFSEIEGGAIGDDGQYHFLDAAGWFHQANRYPFLVRVVGELAGFALVEQLLEPASNPPGSAGESLTILDEFFILRKFRRIGVGRLAAFDVFGRFPGRWTLSQTAHNRGAHAFWRKIIDEYTGGRFDERSDPTDPWHTTWQSFRSPGIGRSSPTRP
jgi:predicted acetyltransferase